MTHDTKWLTQACALIAAAMASGCSTQPLDLHSASQGSQLTPVTVKTSRFTVQTLQPARVDSKVLRVYIEGDGRAWITRHTISDDPTPIKSMAPGMAVNDPQPAVYLARPCQYVLGANCSQRVWTTGRFGKEVLQAESEVLDALKSRYGIQEFELVGYSGGGAVALLLAATRDDVKQVQTIAGNIDTAAWTTLKHLAPLTDSLNPVDFSDQLATVPQRHFIGMNDTVVPAGVSKAYMLKVQPTCGETVFVSADHHAGYEDSWAANRDRAIRCER
ncbi:alpha/beta hydrolase [Pseudomonas putida]|uniref:alpha/beta fold hydrolase n=1 Tax=Pseudomonas putida TaxID=303 RepID=UPI0023633570|nr:alpha/beta hydrolase [Pseudomonas putida]MDD2139513.1 alpha/beta hydrolase [Pseudomonas putida]HDS1721841.1 alpha/beta hydrolase [Pseudomonas putida]